MRRFFFNAQSVKKTKNVNTKDITLHRGKYNTDFIGILPNDLLFLILVQLNPEEFYKMGAVSNFFYHFTRSPKGTLARNPGIIIYESDKNQKIDTHLNKAGSLQSKIRSGDNLGFFREAVLLVNTSLSDFSDNLKNLIELAILHKNFDAFRFCMDFLFNQSFLIRFSKSAKKQLQINSDTIIISKLLGLEILSKTKENNFPGDPITPQMQEKTIKSLIDGGPRFILEVIKFLSYITRTLSLNNVNYIVKTNFLQLTYQNKGQQAADELLSSAFYDYFIKYEGLQPNSICTAPTALTDKVAKVKHTDEKTLDVNDLLIKLKEKDEEVKILTQKLNEALKIIQELHEKQSQEMIAPKIF